MDIYDIRQQYIGEQMTKNVMKRNMKGYKKKAISMSVGTAKISTGIKEVYGNDGKTVITGDGPILERFRESAAAMYATPPTVTDETINQVPRLNISEEEEKHLTKLASESEVWSAVMRLSNGKGTTSDTFSIELIKMWQHVPILKTLVTDLVNKCLTSSSMATSWLKLEQTPLFKKGKRTDVNNYRMISLTTQLGKLVPLIIMRRLSSFLEQKSFFPHQSWGFRDNRGIWQPTFVLQRLLEQAKKFGKDVYVCFLDIIKAYDTVNRGALTKLLTRLGIPKKMVDIIDAWHTNNIGCIKINGKLSEPFKSNVGVRQGGCIGTFII
jgi:hypothetical protein